MPVWIRLPNESECEDISREFEKLTGMPNFIGAIDGSHIPILPPSNGYRDFINRKGWASYVLQGLVDDKLRFRHINIESPGSNHDATVFKNSTLYQHYPELLYQTTKTINGVPIPFMIMGDPAYPLLTWLMKGFVFSGTKTANEESFNAYINSERVRIEMAFGKLKSRWRRLAKRSDVHYTFVPHIVSACCTLHNILETRKEQFKNQWNKQRKNYEMLFSQPENIMLSEEIVNAKEIRNVLVDIVSRLPQRKSLY